MRFAPLFILALTVAACGPSGGDDSTGDDNAGAPDANNNNAAPDANVTTGATQLGDPCTPDAADPMGAGTCDAGFTCVSLTGGSGAWCSHTCTMDSGATECDAYLGDAQKGWGYCFWQVDFDGMNTGNPPVPMCGIVCMDTSGMCSAAGATCDGTCPGTQTCAANLGPATGCQ